MEAGYSEWLGRHETPASEQIIGVLTAPGTSSHNASLNIILSSFGFEHSIRIAMRSKVC